MKVFLNETWSQYWQGRDPFKEARAVQGQVYRNKEGRRTLRFEQERQGFFLKYHEGVGWKEILKNFLQFRLPVLGAANEFNACNALKKLNIDTMTPVAFGERGNNPAQQESFLITEELANTVSLEDYCKSWSRVSPSLREKRSIIRKLAQISKTLHENGINHRDYYLCHFLRAENSEPFCVQDALYLIDLHRAQIRQATPQRWLIKDLAGLFYSAFDLSLTRHDVLCFLAVYRREWLRGEVKTLREIASKAVALYQKDFGRDPPTHIQHILSYWAER